jgi:hypothetical protein
MRRTFQQQIVFSVLSFLKFGILSPFPLPLIFVFMSFALSLHSFDDKSVQDKHEKIDYNPEKG